MEFNIIPNEQTPRVPQKFVFDADYLERNREVFNKFLDFAREHNNAVGLAANQCSVDGKRFLKFVFAHKNTKTGKWSLKICPKITEYVGMCETKAEGCLTWKGMVILAERYRGLTVEYYDIDGNFHVETTHGFDAQIWQHEINHLNGIPETVVEHIPPEIEFMKEPNRNQSCPCGSGKKYKKCCYQLK
jgi:peptide deformylase